MRPRPIADVDLAALARNYERVASAAGGAACGAVVKANAYGLGIGPVANALSAAGCREFFVATLDEGIELRGVLPDARIFVLEGASGETVANFADAGLVPVLNTLAQVVRWSGSGLPAALHVDTGMNRLGLGPAEVETLSAQRELLGGLDIAYLMTHLACADEPEHPLNRGQLERFEQMRVLLPPAPTSIGNSAAAFLGPEFCGDLVRPGIALYGGNPFEARESPVEPVVTLRAPVIQVRTIERRATIGYGATSAVEPGARIAVVALGYADGYPRSLGNRGRTAIDGTVVPVVGRVSMDLVCLDVSALPGAVEEGTYVEFFGGQIGIDDVAAAAGTISYELLTSIGRRVERRYRKG